MSSKPQRERVGDVIGAIGRPILGYDVPEATITELEQVGDSKEWRVTVRGRSGTEVSKTARLSGVAQLVASSRAEIQQEMWYRVFLAARSALLDLAEAEGIEAARD